MLARLNRPSHSLSSLVCCVALSVACAHNSPAGVDSEPKATKRSTGGSSAEAGDPDYRTVAREGVEEEQQREATPPTGERTTAELEKRARARELGGREYRWHDYPRQVRGDLECPEVELVEYGGELLDYRRTIEINPAFRSRLVRFERIVREVAVDVYGRPPDRVVNFGGYSCRSVGGDGEKLSEHAFGHAIDVAGFDFEPVSGSSVDRLRHPRAGDGFEVRVEDHWNASGGFTGLHSEFLHRLASELKRRGPFSGMLGPAYPNHDRVFHFDFGPEFFFRI